MKPFAAFSPPGTTKYPFFVTAPVTAGSHSWRLPLSLWSIRLRAKSRRVATRRKGSIISRPKVMTTDCSSEETRSGEQFLIKAFAVASARILQRTLGARS